MKVTVVQPPYFAGETPDEVIAKFLFDELDKTEENSLIVLPEYSNAGGLSEKEREIEAMKRAPIMLKKASDTAREKGAYVVINVLEERDGKYKNSTYLFNKKGEVAFIYDKIHLPPSEVKLGVVRGEGDCYCTLDGIKFGFMTCYDVYFNEQIEYLATKKPDIILVPGYQRGERVDIIHSQAKLTAFRTNSFVARSSYSMESDEKGGSSMIVSPEGQIIENIGKEVGSISAEIDYTKKFMRPAGFGEGLVRNDDFIGSGLCPEVFENLLKK